MPPLSCLKYFNPKIPAVFYFAASIVSVRPPPPSVANQVITSPVLWIFVGLDGTTCSFDTHDAHRALCECQQLGERGDAEGKSVLLGQEGAWNQVCCIPKKKNGAPSPTTACTLNWGSGGSVINPVQLVYLTRNPNYGGFSPRDKYIYASNEK